MLDGRKPKMPMNISGVSENQKYNGDKINTITDYFGAGAEELDGVRFTYWKLEKDKYEKVKQGPNNKTVEEVKKILQENGVHNTSGNYGRKVTDTSGKAGVKVSDLEDGYYWFVENEDTKLAESNTIVDYKAVPFGLELPVYKADGTMFGKDNNGGVLHIYPKNSTTKINVDGDFTKVIVEKDKEIEKSEDASASIGEEITYKLTTKIPANVKYKQAYWVDK